LAAKRTRKNHDKVTEEIVMNLARGIGFKESCQMAGVSQSQGYVLRRKYPVFEDECKRLLGSALHRQRLTVKRGSTEAAKKKDWREQFVVHYRETGDRVMAANAVDRSIGDIEEMLNPAGDNYDEELASLMREEEVRKLWQIEDAAFRTAIKGDNNTMQKFLLQNLQKDRFGQADRHGDKTLNVFWFSKESELKTLKELDGLFDESTQDTGPILDVGPEAPVLTG
jgi:hypothetical protein